MIVGLGMDLCNINRIDATLTKFGKRFMTRCFTSNEIRKCDNIKNKSACFAKRFASKEAVSKALGTGINKGVYWRHIEIINMKSGKPKVVLKGNAKKVLYNMIPKNKKPRLSITITDENGMAQAFVLIEAL